MISDERIDMAETVLARFPGLPRAFEILREQETTPECSVSRQSHFVQAGRAAIDGFSQFLPEIGPWDIPYFSIMGPEVFSDLG
jgi:hypothetical protein